MVNRRRQATIMALSKDILEGGVHEKIKRNQIYNKSTSKERRGIMHQLLLTGILGDYEEEWFEVIFRMSFHTRNGRLVRSRTGRPFPIRIRHFK